MEKSSAFTMEFCLTLR